MILPAALLRPCSIALLGNDNIEDLLVSIYHQYAFTKRTSCVRGGQGHYLFEFEVEEL